MSKILKIKNFQCSENLYFNGFPSSISLEVTNRCNLKCSHCHRTYRSKMSTGDLPPEVFDKIRPYLGNEIRNISLNGLGEPLLSTQWDFIYNTCLDSGNLNVSFITNGLIPLEHTEKLIKNNLGITFSIDGASSSLYQKIRMADVFDRVITNIKAIDEYKKNKGSVHPVMGAIFVVTVQNMHEMPEFIRMAHEIGLAHVTLTHIVAHFESQLVRESAFFRREEHDRYLVDAQNKATELGITLVHMGTFDKSTGVSASHGAGWLFRDGKGKIRCGLIENWCMVNYTGHIQVCCAPDSLLAGDLRENSLFEIWNGAVYRKLKTGLSHSFEKTCGDACNLKQTICLDDIRGFFCGFCGQYDYDPKKVISQPYNVTDLNKAYDIAVKALQAGNNPSVFQNCDYVLKIEPLAFEAENLKGVAFAFSGEKEKAAQCFLRSYGICKDYETSIVNLRNLSVGSSQ